MRNDARQDRHASLKGQLQWYLRVDGAVPACPFPMLIPSRIKRGSNRAPVESLTAFDTDPAKISGGYIIKIDRSSPDGSDSFNAGTGEYDRELISRWFNVCLCLPEAEEH